MIRPATSLVAVAAAATLVVSPATVSAANAANTLPNPTAIVSQFENIVPLAGVLSPTALPSAAAIPGLDEALGIISLPFALDGALRGTFVVETGGYKTDSNGNYLDKNGKIIKVDGVPITDPAQAPTQVVKNTANILEALAGAFNKLALTGKFDLFVTAVTDYLTQFSGKVMALPLTLLGAVGPAFPSFAPASTQTAKLATTTAAADPVSASLTSLATDAGPFVKVLGIPLANLEQVRGAAFVTTGGYKTDSNGNYLDKNGKIIKVGGVPITSPTQAPNDVVPNSANILAAISAVVNKGLTGDFSGVAKIQDYLTQFAINVVSLPGAIIKYDVDTITGAFSGFGSLSPLNSASPAGGSPQTFSGLAKDGSNAGGETGTVVAQQSLVPPAAPVQPEKKAALPKWSNLKPVLEGAQGGSQPSGETKSNDSSNVPVIPEPGKGPTFREMISGIKDGLKGDKTGKSDAGSASATSDAAGGGSDGGANGGAQNN